MNEKELNRFLIEHQNDIAKFSRKYAKYCDFDEFKQELLLLVYKHMKDNFDPSCGKPPEALFYTSLGNLAVTVYRQLSRERAKRRKQAQLLEENIVFWNLENIDSQMVREVILENLNDNEKQIVAAIDYECGEKGFSYKKVAIKLGISDVQLGYSIRMIRKKLKRAIESNKIS